MEIVIFDVWGQQEGYVSLCNKDNKWHEEIFQWPKEKKAITKWIKDNQGSNIYWCPTVLSEPARKKENVMPTKFLWADLDEADPTKIPIKPTIAWESSPGRYQCLWVLDDMPDLRTTEDINKKLSYFVGADKGGWDLTQVLRIPGSTNYKYEPARPGKMLWCDYDIIYNMKSFSDLPEVQILTDLEPEDIVEIESHDMTTLIAPYIKDFDATLFQLLFEPAPEDFDRSEKLWQLECKLAEAGVPREAMIQIAAASPWNKYAGRADETKRLNVEAMKAIENVEVKAPTQSLDRLVWTTYGDLQGQNIPQPSWLIDGFWGVGENGMVAGEPKTYKSIITTDMAISIASGKPFLGSYPVNKQGPVLMIQQENSPFLMKDRTNKIAMAKGLFHGDFNLKHNEVHWPDDIPLHMMNNAGFDLTNKLHLKALVRKIEEVKPLLIIMDPMYLMLGGTDENSMKELRPILNYLIDIKNDHGTSVILVHHWNKSGTAKRGGQRMYGSVAWHGWVESAIYAKVKDEQKHIITVEREFRGFEKPENVDIRFQLGQPGEAGYEAEVYENNSAATTDELLTVLGCSAGLTEAELCASTGWSRTKVRAEVLKHPDIEKVSGGKGRGNASIYKLKEDV